MSSASGRTARVSLDTRDVDSSSFALCPEVGVFGACVTLSEVHYTLESLPFPFALEDSKGDELL
jgi:hypothetical protein